MSAASQLGLRVLWSFSTALPIQTQGQWSATENDVLPLAPCASLLDQAKASLLYANSCFPLQQASDPGVVFSKASLLTGEEGAVNCPEAVKFYKGIQDAKLEGLNYFAAVGVSPCQQCPILKLLFVKFPSSCRFLNTRETTLNQNTGTMLPVQLLCTCFKF